MFKLALRMFRSDFRTLLQGWAMVVLGLLCVFVWSALPLFGEELNIACFGYAIMYSISLVKPRFTRAFHVVPFTIKQIKMLVIYRMILFMVLIGIGSTIGIGIAEVCGDAWNPRFGLWIFLYLELLALWWEESLKGFHIQARTKKNIIWMIAEVILILVSSLLTLGVLEGVVPIYAEYLIQMVLFLLYMSYFVYYVYSKMDFYDYRQIANTLTDREEFMV